MHTLICSYWIFIIQYEQNINAVLCISMKSLRYDIKFTINKNYKNVLIYEIDSKSSQSQCLIFKMLITKRKLLNISWLHSWSDKWSHILVSSSTIAQLCFCKVHVTQFENVCNWTASITFCLKKIAIRDINVDLKSTWKSAIKNTNIWVTTFSMRVMLVLMFTICACLSQWQNVIQSKLTGILQCWKIYGNFLTTEIYSHWPSSDQYKFT